MNIPDYWGVGGETVFRVAVRPNDKFENKLFEDVARDIQYKDESLLEAKSRLEGGYHDFIEPWIDIIYVKAKDGEEAEEKAKKYWLKHGYVPSRKNMLKHYIFWSSVSNKNITKDIIILPHTSQEFRNELYRW